MMSLLLLRQWCHSRHGDHDDLGRRLLLLLVLRGRLQTWSLQGVLYMDILRIDLKRPLVRGPEGFLSCAVVVPDINTDTLPVSMFEKSMYMIAHLKL